MNKELSITKFYKLSKNNYTPLTGHHHNDMEINYILKGNMQVVYEEKVINLHKGDIFIGGSRGFHKNNTPDIENTEFIVFHFNIDNYLKTKQSKVYSLNIEEQNIMNMIINDCKKLNNGKISKLPFTITPLLNVLLYKLSQRTEDIKKDDNKSSKIYNDAVIYMNKNINKNLTVKDIARHCNVCETTLKEIFKNLVNTGIAKYFLNLKIEKSKELLKENYSVSEISYILGFSSISYFSYCFKRECNISPLQYKKIKS